MTRAERMGELEEPQLPELQQTVLDEATVAALFRDLEADAQIEEVRLKSHAERSADAQPTSLVVAREALSNGSAVGAQILYQLHENSWCDTLMRTSDGMRLVRIRIET